ncbi:outer membrane protein assembly factor BamB [Spongiibacter sp. KMU-158]|uniref:Outer membrane protein assembly factor BamB n=1 Tax=Spongiibacter pelagi TaxID=2760804 RepID=A0A927GWC6_9GAMM|nr:outer membrane protein assembly factor BamB [Spongiibacter pelagi]MBD2858289.1 outer membrane protein assembly factor BamB [Spongiibacter pelagi]
MKMAQAVRLLAAIFLGLSLAACSSTPSSSEPAKLVDFKEEKRLKKVWSRSIGDGQGKAYHRITPVIDGEEIFIAAHDGVVAAYTTAKGKKVWKRSHDLNISGGVGVGGAMVFVGTSDGEVVALDRLTGDIVWKTAVQGEVLSAPASNGSVVVAQTYSGQVHGFDIVDGKMLWTYNAQVPRLTLRGTSTPVIVRDTVLVGLANGRVAALDVDSGSVRWEQRVSVPQGSTEIERLVDVDGRLLLTEGDQIVVATAYQGKLLAVDIAGGRPLWAKDASSYVGATEALGNIYVVDDQGTISAVSDGGRTINWTQTQLARRELSEPLAQSGSIVVGDYEGYLHLIAQIDGHLEGRDRIDSSGMRAPMASDAERIYVYSNDGKLAAYRIVQR